MIIKHITLTNFGIYGQENQFDLTPRPTDSFNRPVILFKGKNGTGKTTLIEAIRLCLHGSLALGQRVSRAEYEAHLASRIHVPDNSESRPTTAKISLTLDHVSVGHQHTYAIERSWQHLNDKTKETLTILENGQPIADLDTLRQKDSFLRELVPPRVAEIFFFDGEKVQMLADDDTSQDLLAGTVKTLLGLHLVEQLQKDLDIYLAQQELSSGLKTLQSELKTLSHEKDQLEQKRLALQAEYREVQQAIHQIEQKITHQEQKIANEGSWFADRLDDLKATRQRLIIEIETQRKLAQELATGLLPFAVAPEMLKGVARRLDREKSYEQAISAQQALKESYAQLEAKWQQPHYLPEREIVLDEETLTKLLAEFKGSLLETIQLPSIETGEIILPVSETERQTLFSWIDQALDPVPKQFCQIINHLNVLEKELVEANDTLKLVPDDENLRPLVETLQQYHQELGALRQQERNLEEQLERVANQLERLIYQLRAVHQQLAEHKQHDRRIQLASKTHMVLEDYAQALIREKTTLLEEAMTKRFNTLSRKTSLIEAIKINPDSFRMTLFRQQKPFGRSQLSAGENQLLAIAIMWALRDVSGVPMPVILDTPIGRLDSDHRRRMIDEYFPRASHQVILLATDAEIDTDLETRLQPAISHSYDLTHHAPQNAPFAQNGQGLQLCLIQEEALDYETE